MKIIVARTAGFCMGVRRAVEMALDASRKSDKPIFTFGPLIHNPQVLSLLEEKKIRVMDRIPERGEGTVLIRAHGVPPDIRETLNRSGLHVIDATCPKVIKVQTIISRHVRDGYAAIIVGDPDHPEVVGLLGHAVTNGHVIEGPAGLDALPAFEKAIIVAQTTQDTGLFESVRKHAALHYPDYRCFNTICDSTENRQIEVEQMARGADAIIVVGGRDSGNTRRLAERVRNAGKPAFHIESVDDLDEQALADAKTIGITAGASTPNWVIRHVYRRLEMLPRLKGRFLRNQIYSLQRNLLLSNIYVSLGAGCLAYAGIRLRNIPLDYAFPLIAILYALSMHIFNNLMGSKADQYNDPEKSRFYQENRLFLSLLAASAGFAGLLTSFGQGGFIFICYLLMSTIGLLYHFRLIPEKTAAGVGIARFRDIPGSKTVLIAMAWGIVTVLLPVLSPHGNGLTWATAIVFSWITVLVFVRTAFFDIFDMQGDRIVGRETIPLILGERTTRRLLMLALAIVCFLMILGVGLGLVSQLGSFLLVCPALLFTIIIAHEQGLVIADYRNQFMVDSLFILAGLITLGRDMM